MDGWFASWRCNCTDVEPERDQIPDRCPTHGEPLLGPGEPVVGARTMFGVVTAFDYGRQFTVGAR